MIEDSLSKRKHVMHYDTEIIPTESEIKEILEIGYSLATSKAKAYPYKFYVLGPNAERSMSLWNLAEGNKIQVDINALGPTGAVYRSNPGLLHLVTAPYTMIVTPRTTKPNEYYRKTFRYTNSHWQLDDPEFVNKNNREACAIEIGMIAKTITGAALDRGWDTSYNVCFPKPLEQWVDFPYLDFSPALMQTIGKGKNYFYEVIPNSWAADNVAPPFEDVFQFVDKDNLCTNK